MNHLPQTLTFTRSRTLVFGTLCLLCYRWRMPVDTRKPKCAHAIKANALRLVTSRIRGKTANRRTANETLIAHHRPIRHLPYAKRRSEVGAIGEDDRAVL
ncbi:hypothetical protein HMPREF1314_0268, partial [Bifidobacterium longum subsp. longum 35B]